MNVYSPPLADPKLERDLKQALSNRGAICGDCSMGPGDWAECDHCSIVLDSYVSAVILILIQAERVAKEEATEDWRSYLSDGRLALKTYFARRANEEIDNEKARARA